MQRAAYFFEQLVAGMLPFVMLMVVGVLLTVKSGFYQFRRLPQALRVVFTGKKQQPKSGEPSPLQAACTALSSTVGTGNIAGVAGAVAWGGPGAVFWMWVSAFAGMCVKSAEILLAIQTREVKNGHAVGGPMYAIQNGLSKKWRPLAYAFALSALPACFCSGAATQVGAVAAAFGTSQKGTIFVGLAFAVVCAAVLIGGAEKIGRFNQALVPLMAGLYVGLTLWVILRHIEALPAALAAILKGAFSPSAVTGGAVGSVITAVITGASKGVFSNEAGLGTSAMAHAAARGDDLERRALYGIFEVFVDTLLICTLTALTILCSGVKIEYGTAASAELVRQACTTVCGRYAAPLLSCMMALFGLSSVIGWGYYGGICTEFVFGQTANRVFSAVYPLFCVAGAAFSMQTAWRLSAFFNGVMLCCNMTAVILLADRPLRVMKSR